jgi:hypothetical protein
MNARLYCTTMSLRQTMLETELRYLPFYFSDGTYNKFPFRDTHETLREYFARLSMALPGETLSHVVFDRRKLSDKDLDMTIQEFVAKMDSEGAEFRQMIGVKKKSTRTHLQCWAAGVVTASGIPDPNPDARGQRNPAQNAPKHGDPGPKNATCKCC